MHVQSIFVFINHLYQIGLFQSSNYQMNPLHWYHLYLFDNIFTFFFNFFILNYLKIEG